VSGEERPVIWAPFPGFQTQALAAADDDILLGGAKGGGKTDLVLVKPLRWVDKPAFAGLVLRQHFTDLKRVMDRARSLYSQLGPPSQRPAWNGELKRWTWPSGAFVQFNHAARVEDLGNVQGGNWSYVGYDEVGNQPDERVVDTLIAELRSPDPSIRRQFVGTANPGFAGHAWVKRRYVDTCGKQGGRAVMQVALPDGRDVQLTRRFLPGGVRDNPVLANDPTYMAQLAGLPERMRRCLLDGDWDAATGSALDELDPAVHLIPDFEPHPTWPRLAAFDWGFAHWWVFIWGVVTDDGRLLVKDTLKGRRMRDWDIAGKLTERVPADALRVVHAGHDCWQEHVARGDRTPSTAEFFGSAGIGLVKANTARAQGYRELLARLAWRESEYLPRRQPLLQFADTPGNRWLLEEHLPSIVVDPDDPSDVLKVDADPETGRGGDDGYDCLRYLCASRPCPAPGLERMKPQSLWDEVMLREVERQRNNPDLQDAYLTQRTKARRNTPYLGI
jgi:hypothetical protein